MKILAQCARQIGGERSQAQQVPIQKTSQTLLPCPPSHGRLVCSSLPVTVISVLCAQGSFLIGSSAHVLESPLWVCLRVFCACSVSDPSRPSQHPQPDQGATTSRCTLHFLAASSASWAISRFLCLGSGMCLVSASHRPPLSCFLSLALRPPSPSRSLVSALPLPLPLLSAVVVDE
jgi:hypothetical protein